MTVTTPKYVPPDCGCISCKQMAWDDFEQMLVNNGWTPEAAKREREAQEYGDLGDCDGDIYL